MILPFRLHQNYRGDTHTENVSIASIFLERRFYMQKFGRTLVFLFLILIFVLGAKMALKISVPFLRPISASLADAIQSS